MSFFETLTKIGAQTKEKYDLAKSKVNEFKEKREAKERKMLNKKLENLKVEREKEESKSKIYSEIELEKKRISKAKSARVKDKKPLFGSTMVNMQSFGDKNTTRRSGLDSIRSYGPPSVNKSVLTSGMNHNFLHGGKRKR